ncbi:MAG TPA: hypothetical protein VMZ00_07510 [Sporichthya sp.]|nr:hypothetical protein [Sporichthya sp.]
MATARRTVRGIVAKSPSVTTAYRELQYRRGLIKPPLIFVLGSQRSGTNVLRQSLSLDPYVQGFNERKNSELYVEWALRPEPEIRPVLTRFRNTVLLKPIQSVIRRPVADFLAEFNEYPLKVAWIYRDPVAVFRSRGARWSYKAESGPFIEEWNRINASVMDADDPRVAVVCYDQLTGAPTVFHTLCNFLGIRGENLFHSGRPIKDVESSLSEEDVADIRKQTGEQLHRLDAAAAQFLATNSSANTEEEGDGPDPSAIRSAQPSATG